MPVLACADPEAEAAFLTGALGFRLAGWWRDDGGAPRFGIVRLGDVTLGLERQAQIPPSPGWGAYIFVEDARDFAAMAAAGGATLIRGPEDTAYATRELEIATPGGHRLCFAQDLAPSAEGPGL